MKGVKATIIPEQVYSDPLKFDPEICNGCNLCIEICQVDIMLPNPVKKKPPIVAFPGECWYCGSCVSVCPKPGAIELRSTLINSVHWKRKETGEDFYL
ncbi:MAG: 4Fe-4S dicluster domain-containing protein [bacterium]|nr:4Fe-4S dicluster domain-containing protein [bacterium]